MYNVIETVCSHYYANNRGIQRKVSPLIESLRDAAGRAHVLKWAHLLY